MIKQFSDVFSETIAAVKLSDPTLSSDQIFERAWTQARFAAHAVRLSDPSTDQSLSPERQAEYDAYDQNLLQSAVDHALQVSADSQPEKPVPAVGANYAAALAKIAASVPPMARAAAMALAIAGQKKDREIQIERAAQLASSAPAGNPGQVRA